MMSSFLACSGLPPTMTLPPLPPQQTDNDPSFSTHPNSNNDPDYSMVPDSHTIEEVPEQKERSSLSSEYVYLSPPEPTTTTISDMIDGQYDEDSEEDDEVYDDVNNAVVPFSLPPSSALEQNPSPSNRPPLQAFRPPCPLPKPSEEVIRARSRSPVFTTKDAPKSPPPPLPKSPPPPKSSSPPKSKRQPMLPPHPKSPPLLRSSPRPKSPQPLASDDHLPDTSFRPLPPVPKQKVRPQSSATLPPTAHRQGDPLPLSPRPRLRSQPVVPKARSSSRSPGPPLPPALPDDDGVDPDDPYLQFQMDLESLDISKLTLEQLDRLDPRQAQLWMLLKMHQMVRKVEDVYVSAEQLYVSNQGPPPLPSKPPQNQTPQRKKMNYENTVKGPVPLPRKRLSKYDENQEPPPADPLSDSAQEQNGEESDTSPKVKLYRKKKVIGKLTMRGNFQVKHTII